MHLCTDSLNNLILFELMGCSVELVGCSVELMGCSAELMGSSDAVILRVPEPPQKKKIKVHADLYNQSFSSGAALPRVLAKFPLAPLLKNLRHQLAHPRGNRRRAIRKDYQLTDSSLGFLVPTQVSPLIPHLFPPILRRHPATLLPHLLLPQRQPGGRR